MGKENTVYGDKCSFEDKNKHLLTISGNMTLQMLRID